jgi:hypothetical protein
VCLVALIQFQLLLDYALSSAADVPKAFNVLCFGRPFDNFYLV